MIKIKIMTEFLHSPIWTYDEGIVIDDISVILEDEKVQVLCEKIEKRPFGDSKKRRG